MLFFVVFYYFICVAYCDEFYYPPNETYKYRPEYSDYIGRISLPCITKYYQLFTNPQIPPRNYRYFHESNFAGDGSELRFRIVGGNTIDIIDAPYMIMYGRYCGGCLIAPNWGLTAAHCKNRDYYITAGSSLITEGDKYPVCGHYIHPKWSDIHKLHYHDWDYQLLLLEYPVPVTPKTRPIAIGTLDDIAPGKLIYISGWGHTQDKQKYMQNRLRQVSLPIITHAECRSMSHPFYKNITPRMFCAGYSKGIKDSCQGDSGGPAVIDGKLVGLVSFGIGCAEPGQPGVYSKAPTARRWIRKVTGLPL